MNQLKSHTALLVMDVQRGIVDRHLKDRHILERLPEAIAIARSRECLVVYVIVQFRPGFPEISPRNKTFSAIARPGSIFGEPSAAEVHPNIAPADTDIVVTKRRVSAFTGSDLEVVLRARQIDSLVLTGIATSGVVLSTLREAADRDYALTVLSDCCADADEEVHRVLIEKIFPRQADVLTVAQWRAAM